jgi:hypothetical protein
MELVTSAFALALKGFKLLVQMGLCHMFLIIMQGPNCLYNPNHYKLYLKRKVHHIPKDFK